MVSLSLLVAALLCINGALSNNYQFGTYERLFSAQSLWNSRPVKPVFSSNPKQVIQPSTMKYYPDIAEGEWSTGIYLAKATDPPVTVYGSSSKGLNNIDGYDYINNVTIPRWPAASVPASGSDGHLDIVDPITGIVHSFWILEQNPTTLRWTANQYAWSVMEGTGWGDGGHFYQGARATGVPTSGGVIRTNEINDGDSIFYHALAMSLAHNSLSKNPTYVYPATSADGDAASTNTGLIPEGALLMLPPSYNTSRHNSYPRLKKVAETLKVYGAYIVDRNTATPFVIYVENGSKYRISNMSTWDTNLANQLQAVSDALRMVVSADYYLDGHDEKLLPPTNVQMMSMRATHQWKLVAGNTGDAVPRYDSWSQSLVFEGNNTLFTSFRNTDGFGIGQVSWGRLVANKTYIFSASTTGEYGMASIKIEVVQAGTTIRQSDFLKNGQNFTFTHPSGGYYFFSVRKAVGGPASVRGMITTNENIAFVNVTNQDAFVPANTNKPTVKPTSAPTGTTTGNNENPSTDGPSTTTTAAGVSSTGIISPVSTSTGQQQDMSSNAIGKESVVLVLLVAVLVLLF